MVSSCVSCRTGNRVFCILYTMSNKTHDMVNVCIRLSVLCFARFNDGDNL